MKLKNIKAKFDLVAVAAFASLSMLSNKVLAEEAVVRTAEEAKKVLLPLNNLILLLSIVAGVIFTAAMIIGAAYYMTAGDNPEQKHKGKSYIQGAILGLVIVVSTPLLRTYFGV